MLKDHDFSDLIISESNTFLKGCSGIEQGALKALPDDCDISGLLELINAEFMKRSLLREDGTGEIPQSLRITFQNMKFRVADIKDVNNEKTWFLRRLPDKVGSLEEIGFPLSFSDWLLDKEQHKGLILISGSQASGKTTLGSTIVAERLRKYGGHGVTFENPPECPLHGEYGSGDLGGFCWQTEINGEKELESHIERAYRYASPRIVYIGEIRTKYAATEVLRMALSSSQQLIIATIHGKDIVSALTRLITWATEIEGVNARNNLADSLLAIFHTHLEINSGSKALQIPEFLFLPFNNNSLSLRSKIRDNTLLQLNENINQQRSRITRTQNQNVKTALEKNYD